jgi:hypothetical protein
MIFGQGHSPGAAVQSLGTRLAVALQGPSDNKGNFLREPPTAGDDSQQLLARKAPEQLVIERDD